MRVFKCLDYDEIVGSKICMSKDLDLSNLLFSRKYLKDVWLKKKVNNTRHVSRGKVKRTSHMYSPPVTKGLE